MPEVQLTSDALEDLKDLDGAARQLVLKALRKLESDPELRGAPLGASTSTGDLTTFRKLVVGNRDYRIIYRVQSDGTIVVVWVIAKRADAEVYELAAARLRTHGDRAIADELLTMLDSVKRL